LIDWRPVRRAVLLLGLVSLAAYGQEESSWRKLAERAAARLRAGDAGEAADLFRSARETAVAHKAGAESIAVIEFQLGVCHHVRGDFEVAVRHFEQALERAPDHEHRLLWRTTLANARAELGEYDAAEFELCTVLETVGEENPYLRGLCLVGLSRVDSDHGRVREALEFGRRATDVLGGLEPGHPWYGPAMLVLTDLAVPASEWKWLLGERDDAVRQLEGALEFLERTRGGGAARRARLATALVRRLIASGRVERARAFLEVHSANAPDRGPAALPLRIAAAELDLGRGRLDEAARTLRDVVKTAANPRTRDEFVVRLLSVRARIAVERGRWDEARADYRRAVGRIDAASPVPRLAAAELRLEWADREARGGDVARAARLAREACDIFLASLDGTHPAFRRALERLERYRARAESEAEGDGQALPELPRGLRRGDRVEPGWEEVDEKVTGLVESARDALAAGEFGAALAACKAARDLRPGDPEVLRANAAVLVELGEWETLSAVVGRARRFGAPRVDDHVALGRLHAKRKKWKRVIVHMTRALVLDAGSREAPVLRAVARYERGDWALAARGFRHALRQSPDSAKISFWLARALMRQGRLDEASEALGRAGARQALGRALVANLRGEPERALELCRRAADAAGSGKSLAVLTGILLHDLGRFEEAARVLAPHAASDARAARYRWLCRAALDGTEAATEELRSALAGGNLGQSAVTRLFAGRVEPEFVLKRRRRARAESRYRTCFYVGAWLARHGWADEARLLLRAAAGADVHIMERQSAIRVLERLGPPPADD